MGSNDDILHEKSVTKFERTFSVNVWCGLLGNRLIGSFVFDNNFTGNTYEVFLRNELPGLLEEMPLMRQMYFQHVWPPTFHSAREYLNESSPNRSLRRGGPVAWTARSPDITPFISVET